MLKNAYNQSKSKLLCHYCCSEHNNKNAVRTVKRSIKQREETQWQREYENEEVTDFTTARRGEVWTLKVENEIDTWVCLGPTAWVTMLRTECLFGEDVSAIEYGIFSGITLDEEALTKYSFN